MSVRWITLASGSGGNASILEIDGRGLLIDIGLGPRQLTLRLAEVGLDWGRVAAVVLTHTHGDHWNRRTFELLLELRIPLFCHPVHRRELQLRATEIFQEMQFARLVYSYDGGCAFSPFDELRFQPLRLSHDGGPTFGFRVDGARGGSAPQWSIGYVADLGSWDGTLVRAMTDVDVLAIEFNHDVELQRSSRRPSWLKERVLGDFGHLSNLQAAHLLGACLRQSIPGRLRHVVQLHLSRDCNRPDLAAAAANEVLGKCDHDVIVQTAEQDRAGAAICLMA